MSKVTQAMKILLAVDESSYSAEAVRAVAERPWPRGTTIRVLSVVEWLVPPLMSSAAQLPYDTAGSLQQMREQRVQTANDLTSKVASSLAEKGLATETAVRDGDPRSVIVDEAKDWPADLIVVGSHGYTGITRWLMGSVAQSVVSHAPCSVEVVRGRAGALGQPPLG
jgi:nucleotide-binding universal stress UspA family protein